MDIFCAIEARRAIKWYDDKYKIPEGDLEKLLSLTMMSPTAFNMQNWRFVVVSDPQLRKQIREHAHDQAQITDASTLIILCADLKAWKKQPRQYWSDAPDRVQLSMMYAMREYYGGKWLVERDEAMRSCGIASMTLMLAARGMGYDSCPIAGFNFEAVASLINLPEDHVISMMVTLGKGIKDAWPRNTRLGWDRIVKTDRFIDESEESPDAGQVLDKDKVGAGV